jgi:hypothetical protein
MTHATHRNTPPFLLLLLAATSLFSCKKEKLTELPVPGNMSYIDLQNKEILFGKGSVSLDLNNDGRKDLVFGTRLVGDPIDMTDKWQWLVFSDIFTNLPVNAQEEIPILHKSDSIPVNDFNGYTWYQLSSILLAQKVISMSGPDRWEGAWKNVIKKHLPLQVVKNEKRYNGWLELSFDTIGEKVILHRAAICNAAETGVKAGE